MMTNARGEGGVKKKSHFCDDIILEGLLLGDAISAKYEEGGRVTRLHFPYKTPRENVS